MFGKQHFYLMYGSKKTKDEDRFNEWIKAAEIFGVRPISYKCDELLETETGVHVTNVTLIECTELWHGALKRWFRKFDMYDTKHEKDGLKIYALPMSRL